MCRRKPGPGQWLLLRGISEEDCEENLYRDKRGKDVENKNKYGNKGYIIVGRYCEIYKIAPIEIVLLLLLLLLLLFTAIGLSPGGSGYFTCKQNMKLATN